MQELGKIGILAGTDFRTGRDIVSEMSSHAPVDVSDHISPRRCSRHIRQLPNQHIGCYDIRVPQRHFDDRRGQQAVELNRAGSPAVHSCQRRRKCHVCSRHLRVRDDVYRRPVS